MSVDLEALKRLDDLMRDQPWSFMPEGELAPVYGTVQEAVAQFPAIIAALERAERVEAAARDFLQAWDDEHREAMLRIGDAARNKRVTLAMVNKLRAALAPAPEGSDGG